MTEITEAEAVEYIKRLMELEHEPGSEKALISIGPFSAFVLIGALQLALRHPEFSPSQASMVNAVIDQMRPLFTGTPGEQLLRLGDEPAYDIERDCKHPFGPHSPKCPPGGHPGFAAEPDSNARCLDCGTPYRVGGGYGEAQLFCSQTCADAYRAGLGL